MKTLENNLRGEELENSLNLSIELEKLKCRERI